MRTFALFPVLFGLAVFADPVDIQFPHMLLPLKSSQPKTPFRTQPDATVSYKQGTGEEQWVAVNFDVPDHGNTLCHINFHLNTNANKNAPTKLQGDAPYSINISRIDPKLANGGTTWETVPNVQEHVATFILDKNGASEVVGKWFVCPKNVAQFIIQPASQRDMEVYWYELDYTQADGGAHGITLEMWA